MSLINDALKRATRNQPTTMAIAPEPAAPMQPVEYRKRGLPWYFFPALLAIIAAACWFIVKGVQARRQASDPTSAPILVKAREPQTQMPAPSPAGAAGAEVSPTASPGIASTAPAVPKNSLSTEAGPITTEASAPSPPPVPAQPPEPAKPAYRLQGIFFRTGNPSAMVNGKSVWTGSQIDGATVKTITRDNLTIEVNGETTVLTLK
jgi:hypothetical protein